MRMFVGDPIKFREAIPQNPPDQIPWRARASSSKEDTEHILPHLSLVHVSVNRTSRGERVWVFGVGFSESTVTTSSPCLVNASFASEGVLEVDMMTSGYLDLACFKLSFNTRAAARYELLVRSATYAFLNPISDLGRSVKVASEEWILNLRKTISVISDQFRTPTVKLIFIQTVIHLSPRIKNPQM